MSIMEIYGKLPRKIIVTGDSILNGCDYDKENAKSFLDVGKEYTVIGQHVHSWSTKVVLEEFSNPEIMFNSVQFEEVGDN